MGHNDNMVKNSFGQNMLKRWSVFAFILLFYFLVAIGFLAKGNALHIDKIKADTSDPVVIQAAGDFTISGGGICSGLSDSGKAKIGDNNFIVQIPNRVTQVGSTDSATAMFDAELQSRVVGIDFSIATNLTIIGNNVFSGLTNLTSVTIPKSVTTIYKDAFRGCTSLKKVVIEEESVLDTIGDHAFYETSLFAIELPNTVNTLGSSESECNAFGSAYVVSSDLLKLGYFQEHGVPDYKCALKIELRFKKSESDITTEYKLACYNYTNICWACLDDGEWYSDQSYTLPDLDQGGWFGSFHSSGESQYTMDNIDMTILNLNSDIYKSDLRTFELTFKPFLTTADPDLQLENNQLVFNRQSQVPQINTTLSADTDFDIEYYKKQSSGSSYNKVDATQVAEVNQYYVLLKGKGKYCGETRLDFSIEKASLTNATIYFTSDDATWQGPNKEVKLQVSNVVTSNGVTLYANEYNVSYRTTRDYTTYGSEVTVWVVSNSDSSFKDYATKTYTIERRNIENVVISGYEKKVPYTGERIEFNELIVNDQGINYELVLDTDYRIVYPYHDTDAGTITIELEGLKNYCGSTTFSYEVEAADGLDQLAIGFRGQDNPEDNEATYNAKPHGKAYVYWKINAQELLANYYTTTYTKNGVILDISNYDEYTGGFRDAGTLQVKVELKGNYKGTLTAEYVIHPREMREGDWKTDGAEMDTTYTGKPIKYFDNKYLSFYDLATQSTFGLGRDDYTRVITRLSGVDDSDTYVNVGQFKVTYTGKNNFTGEKSYTFEIYPYDISNGAAISIREQGSSISFKKDNELQVRYTGSPILVEAYFYAREEGVLGEHYTLTYSEDHTNAGTVTVTITGINNYKGQRLIRFEILPIDIYYLALKQSQATYTGKSFEGNIVNYVTGSYDVKLLEGRDYTLVYTRDGQVTTDFTNVGTIAVEVIGTKSCIISDTPYGPLKKEFKITQYTITQDNAKIMLNFWEAEWRPERLRTYPVITSCTLTNGESDDVLFTLTAKDYDYVYGAYSAGNCGIDITGKGNFTGKAYVSYLIKGRTLSVKNLTIEGMPDPDEIYYAGKYIEFDNLKLIDNFGDGNTYELVRNVDIEWRYENNLHAGEASIIIHACHSYYKDSEDAEELKIHFTIKKLIVTEVTISEADRREAVYNTYAQQPYLIVSDQFGHAISSSGMETSYLKGDEPVSSLINAGTYTIVVKGKGDYTGEATVEFTVKQANLSEGTLTLLDSHSVVFNNKDTSRSLQVEYVFNGKGRIPISQGEYDIVYERISGEGGKDDRKNVGTIKISVVGKETGNFYGELSDTYEITPLLINYNKEKFSFTRLSSNDRFTYTGEEIKITDYTFKYGEYVMVLGKDYEESYSNNINVGYPSLYLEGKGNFDGSYYYQFRIVPADITDIEITVDEEEHPFFAGISLIYHDAEFVDEKYKGQGNIVFEDRILTEGDVYGSEPITLNFTFVCTSGNYYDAHGTYTIQNGVFVRIVAYFDSFTLDSIYIGHPIDFVHVFKDTANGSREITDGFSVTITNALGEVVNSLDKAGQYFIEVQSTNPKYILDAIHTREFYVNAREIVANDDSGIKASSDNGFETGVQLIHEEINEEYRMREILGMNYSDKVHHIEYISFEKDGHTINLDNVKIFLENNNNYDVYMYIAESMPYYAPHTVNVSQSAAIMYNDHVGQMLNITELIRNNQPFTFSGAGVYLVYQIAEHSSRGNFGSNNSSSNPIIFIAIGAVALIAIVTTVIIVVKAKKKKKAK